MVSLGLHKSKENLEVQIQKVVAKSQRNAQIVEDENRSIDNEMNAGGGVDFAYLLSQDELMSDMLDESKAAYQPMLKPLKPFFSRLMFLTKIDERGLFDFKIAVDIAITQRKNDVLYDENGEYNEHCSEDYQLLEAVRTYLQTRIYDSVMGFKVEALTTRRKIVDVTDRGPAKQPGLLTSLAGQTSGGT